MSRPWRRTGRGWKDLADRELKPRTQRFMRRPGREPQTEDRQRAGQGPGEPASHRERRTRPGGCHPRRGDRGGWAPAGCSQPWDMREACHTELGGTRPQGPRGQPCTSVCTSQVGTGVGEAGALCRPPRGTPQGGTWRPLQQARLLSGQCVCGQRPGPHAATAGQGRSARGAEGPAGVLRSFPKAPGVTKRRMSQRRTESGRGKALARQDLQPPLDYGRILVVSEETSGPFI